MMENLVTILVVALLVLFHRPLLALAGLIFALFALGVMLIFLFVLVKTMLFGS
jgi:hypothetical protein